MRTPIIAGNWKMNNTVEEALSLVRELKETLNDVKDREVVVCPSFTALYAVANELKGTNLKLGAQNCYFEDEGAYTGEISPVMLKDLGVEYVVIGHSERRTYFNENDDLVNKKAKALLQKGLKPIICVGETLEQREAGETETLVRKQVFRDLDGIEPYQLKDVVIAYEPIWAIGTGKTATSQEANRVIALIRATIKEMYSEKEANTLRIQYGGSVKPGNAKDLMNQRDIDGALVGGASLKAESFEAIVKY
ncbi:MAG: triose-phosphate isomerase [Firmicutes bacterium]|nr:triose-phosphate isomerase [Bacillota bacterium]MDD4694043.1 triose-phosphate isomerase [Bacillota bacterium]